MYSSSFSEFASTSSILFDSFEAIAWTPLTTLRWNMQIAGAFWYLLAVERNDTCWRKACIGSGKCNIDFLYCGNKHMRGFADWRRVSEKVLGSKCAIKEDNDSSPFNYGIYTQAIESRTVSSNVFFSKFCYCLWWGLQNLRSSSYSFRHKHTCSLSYPLFYVCFQ